MISCLAFFTGSCLQCSACASTDSYEDCQSKRKVENCSNPATDACFQANVKYANGSEENYQFQKGCVQKSKCETYEKGEIGQCNTWRAQGYTVDCKAKCCYEDECNKGNLIESKGSAFLITGSVMVLLSGLLLTLVNIN